MRRTKRPSSAPATKPEADPVVHRERKKQSWPLTSPPEDSSENDATGTTNNLYKFSIASSRARVKHLENIIQTLQDEIKETKVQEQTFAAKLADRKEENEALRAEVEKHHHTVIIPRNRPTKASIFVLALLGLSIISILSNRAVDKPKTYAHYDPALLAPLFHTDPWAIFSMPHQDCTPNFKATLRANKKRLAFFWHPDRSKTTGIPVPVCNKVSLLVNTWYDILRDQVKRIRWEDGDLRVMELDMTGVLTARDGEGHFGGNGFPGIGVFANLGGMLDLWIEVALETLQTCKHWIIPVKPPQEAIICVPEFDEEAWSFERDE